MTEPKLFKVHLKEDTKKTEYMATEHWGNTYEVLVNGRWEPYDRCQVEVVEEIQFPDKHERRKNQ